MTDPERPIRIIIADDHTIVRKGIKAFLSETPGFQFIGEAENGLEAARLAKELGPDVILMDLLMPVMDGIEATRLITAQQPGVHILVLPSY